MARYFGLNDKGYGAVFDTKEELESAGYTFVKEVYPINPLETNREEIPTVDVKPPKFNLSIEKTYLVLPDGTKKQFL